MTDSSIVKADNLETIVMAHRYLYYVESEPVIPDSVYDQLERQARELCAPESPVHGVGSSLPGSYTDKQKALAKRISAQ